MRACIVDDDRTSLELIGEFLEDQGWNVVLFNHPLEKTVDSTSLEDELSKSDNKLLIMDVRFGRESTGLSLGLTTVGDLVNNRTIKSDCMVIFVSQFGQEDLNFSKYKDTLKSKGIDCDWLDKPVDFILLHAKINKVQ